MLMFILWLPRFSINHLNIGLQEAGLTVLALNQRLENENIMSNFLLGLNILLYFQNFVRFTVLNSIELIKTWKFEVIKTYFIGLKIDKKVHQQLLVGLNRATFYAFQPFSDRKGDQEKSKNQ